MAMSKLKPTRANRTSLVPPLPWYVYPVRYTEGGRVHSIQIRDALHNIILVSASYGQHAGAPLSDKVIMAIAEHVCAKVNSGR